MKQELCSAFCSNLEIAEVPIGYVVGTGFAGQAGDNITFFIAGPSEDGLWHIQDDGTTIPYVEALGASLNIATRAQAFEELLEEYGAIYDDETCEIRTSPLAREAIPAAAMQFVALLLRVQDLALLTTERAKSTWIEEALSMLERAVGGRATMERDGIVHPDLEEFPADVVLRAQSRDPVALFFGVSDAKVYEALLLDTYARYQVRQPCSVVVLLETDASVSRKARLRADNHVIVPRFRGGKADAIGRIAEVAVGERPQRFH